MRKLQGIGDRKLLQRKHLKFQEHHKKQRDSEERKVIDERELL